MFTKQEIINLGKDTYSEFYSIHKINCRISVISELKFWEIAKKSKIIKNNIRKGVPLKVGALVFHKNGKDTVFVSTDVINTLTDNPNFVKAIFMHEFFHVYFKSLVKNNNLKEAEISEERVKIGMKGEFPKLAKYFY